MKASPFLEKMFDLIQSTFGLSNIWTKFSHNRWHECVEVLLLLKVHKGDWKVIHNKFWSINNVEFHFVLSATAGIVIFWCLVNSFLTDTHISLQKVNLRTNWYFKSWFFFVTGSNTCIWWNTLENHFCPIQFLSELQFLPDTYLYTVVHFKNL